MKKTDLSRIGFISTFLLLMILVTGFLTQQDSDIVVAITSKTNVNPNGGTPLSRLTGSLDEIITGKSDVFANGPGYILYESPSGGYVVLDTDEDPNWKMKYQSGNEHYINTWLHEEFAKYPWLQRMASVGYEAKLYSENANFDNLSTTGRSAFILGSLNRSTELPRHQTIVYDYSISDLNERPTEMILGDMIYGEHQERFSAFVAVLSSENLLNEHEVQIGNIYNKWLNDKSSERRIVAAKPILTTQNDCCKGLDSIEFPVPNRRLADKQIEAFGEEIRSSPDAWSEFYRNLSDPDKDLAQDYLVLKDDSGGKEFEYWKAGGIPKPAVTLNSIPELGDYILSRKKGAHKLAWFFMCKEDCYVELESIVSTTPAYSKTVVLRDTCQNTLLAIKTDAEGVDIHQPIRYSVTGDALKAKRSSAIGTLTSESFGSSDMRQLIVKWIESGEKHFIDESSDKTYEMGFATTVSDVPVDGEGHNIENRVFLTFSFDDVGDTLTWYWKDGLATRNPYDQLFKYKNNKFARAFTVKNSRILHHDANDGWAVILVQQDELDESPRTIWGIRDSIEAYPFQSLSGTRDQCLKITTSLTQRLNKSPNDWYKMRAVGGWIDNKLRVPENRTYIQQVLPSRIKTSSLIGAMRNGQPTMVFDRILSDLRTNPEIDILVCDSVAESCYVKKNDGDSISVSWFAELPREMRSDPWLCWFAIASADQDIKLLADSINLVGGSYSLCLLIGSDQFDMMGISRDTLDFSKMPVFRSMGKSSSLCEWSSKRLHGYFYSLDLYYGKPTIQEQEFYLSKVTATDGLRCYDYFIWNSGVPSVGKRVLFSAVDEEEDVFIRVGHNGISNPINRRSGLIKTNQCSYNGFTQSYRSNGWAQFLEKDSKTLFSNSNFDLYFSCTSIGLHNMTSERVSIGIDKLGSHGGADYENRYINKSFVKIKKYVRANRMFLVWKEKKDRIEPEAYFNSWLSNSDEQAGQDWSKGIWRANPIGLFDYINYQ